MPFSVETLAVTGTFPRGNTRPLADRICRRNAAVCAGSGWTRAARIVQLGGRIAARIWDCRPGIYCTIAIRSLRTSRLPSTGCIFRKACTAPRSPWQNAYVERVIGSIRRECLDHVIVVNAASLHRVLMDYIAYDMRSRTHLALDKDTPITRPVSKPSTGRIVTTPKSAVYTTATTASPHSCRTTSVLATASPNNPPVEHFCFGEVPRMSGFPGASSGAHREESHAGCGAGVRRRNRVPLSSYRLFDSHSIQRMQKVLTQMNIQLANVISDLSGWTGQRIVRAILAGERDPATLAALSHPGIHATRDTIAKSLEGTWQPDLVFVLQQEVAMYDAYQQRIDECDHELEQHLKGFGDKVADSAADGEPSPTTPRKELRSGPKRRRKAGSHAPQFDLGRELHRISGVDLTRIDGIDVGVAQTVISEVGLDMTRWKTEAHFASWLGLCPDNRITGGKVIRKGTRHVINRAATPYGWPPPRC